jgi:MFS family permease
MIVLDVTIVGVALPSIREDLDFSEESLAWVVNAYLLTFGGFLLLGGGSGTCSVTGGCSWRGSCSLRSRP